jgi:glycosyltransferase involved in cell wall biosynthesis
LNAVKLVITDVPYTVMQLRESGLYGRIACIQSLPHPSLTPLPPPSIRVGAAPRQFRVIAFSYDNYLADLTHFCDALPHLLAQANPHITIVGGTPAAAERLRQRLAHRYPQALGSVVVRPKTVGLKDFVDCITEADLVYFPVYNGLVAHHLLLDTMACGRAVMATRCPAYESFLTHQNAALVSADVTQIADCIQRLMKEPLRSVQLARNAEESIRKERNPAAAISALRSCYTFILMEPHA